MTAVTVRPDRKAMRRAHVHRITSFMGAVRVDGARLVITPARGAAIRVLDDEGNMVSETRESSRTLPSNIGDRLMVWGETLDEIAICIVLAISRDGSSFWVAQRIGRIEPTSTRVRLFPMATPKLKQLGLFGKRRRAA